MRVLLDHNVPPELRHEFPEDLRAETASFRGWEGLSDGDLLRRAGKEYDVFVTLDTSIPDQQAVEDFPVGLVVLDVHPIHPDELRTYVTNLIFGVYAAFDSQSVVIVTEDAVEF